MADKLSLSSCDDCIRANGGCCRTFFSDGWKLILLPGEIKRISAAAKTDPARFVDSNPLTRVQLEWYVSEYEHEDPLWVHFVSIWSRPTGIQGTCPFLSDNGCTLTYQDKPFLCRIYPLDFNITWGGISPPKSTHCPVARLARSNEEVVGRFGDDWKALECGFGEFRQELISLLEAISDQSNETSDNSRM